ncbi:glutamine--fructose-6-phosphate transaminase (isomerizing) [Thermogutta sp.]|jgi:glucosamine--fructose-6-phosphate aminotransferase (isomerizing)|uniref:glutamine--fructose-6-phosphate transaminase (isomerizing) n=1 Tax=Thermogutta sp. TaxID=1962930 RepID=UPI00321F9C9F
MCGIVGCVGVPSAADFLLNGLRRLEYRGYDSAGLALASTVTPASIAVVKAAGRIARLQELVDAYRPQGDMGIGHTRWATHGGATDVNAHPHLGGDGEVVLVHNGVIENYESLRHRLESAGYQFRSETDTEAIAHLIADLLRASGLSREEVIRRQYQPLLGVVQAALSQLRGTWGLAVMFRDYPGVIIAARLGSPLILGVGEGANFVASDASALAGFTESVAYLRDHETAIITTETIRIFHRDQGRVEPSLHKLQLSVGDIDTGGYPHFMLKEIFEQPDSLRNTMRGRLDMDVASAKFGGLNLSPQQLRQVERIILTGCGTSWHAGLVGEYQIEALARIPVEVEYASELRYRNPPLSNNTLLFAITQSGETADTLAALREMKRKGHPTLAICNVVGSTIAQEADGGIYLHAGPEIGVASTKAFTSQCLVLALLALYFGRLRDLSFEAGIRIIEKIRQLPDQVAQALECDSRVRRVADRFYQCRNFLYLGRQFNFPTALEGALKLKEISYIHAEGYPAAEMKHGPIALVDEHTPSVFLLPRGPVYEKVLANMQEIKARGGPIIAVVEEGDREASLLADEIIEVPAVDDFLQPIVFIVPLQLLAYHIAVARGCDVDKPRNLAKSVTVE